MASLFRLEAAVLSTQHDEHASQEQIHEGHQKYVFDPVLPTDMIDADSNSSSILPDVS